MFFLKIIGPSSPGPATLGQGEESSGTKARKASVLSTPYGVLMTLEVWGYTKPCKKWICNTWICDDYTEEFIELQSLAVFFHESCQVGNPCFDCTARARI